MAPPSSAITAASRSPERSLRRASSSAGEEDLDELVGYIAAEANHEKDRRRQKRLDTAFAVINDALTERSGHDPKI